VDADGVGAKGNRRAGHTVSEMRAHDDGAGAYGKTVWSWLPLLQSSLAEMHRPNRVSVHRQFAKRW
jgi:hypothetical protein